MANEVLSSAIKLRHLPSIGGGPTWKSHILGHPVGLHCQIIAVTQRQVSKYTSSLARVLGLYLSITGMGKVRGAQAFLVIPWPSPLRRGCVEILWLFPLKRCPLLRTSSYWKWVKYLREAIPLKGPLPLSKAFCLIDVSQKLFCETHQPRSFLLSCQLQSTASTEEKIHCGVGCWPCSLNSTQSLLQLTKAAQFSGILILPSNVPGTSESRTPAALSSIESLLRL